MKKCKLLCILGLCLITLSGCFKRDLMDDITIITTTYPISYLVENIYGFNSKIDSIYPVGVEIDQYKLTKKQIKKYAKADIFVYNGLNEEKSIAADFFNTNSSLKIIDVSRSTSINYEEEELWLNPSNYLKLAQNIRDKLVSYTNSSVLKQEIDEKFEELKVNISNYDANLKTLAENAENKTIIVGNNLFKFLTKYDFKILSVEENEKKQSDFQEAKNLITNKTNSYIFVLEKNKDDENVKKLENAGAKVVVIKSLKNLTKEEINASYDYQQYMDSFIESIKLEVYN